MHKIHNGYIICTLPTELWDFGHLNKAVQLYFLADAALFHQVTNSIFVAAGLSLLQTDNSFASHVFLPSLF